MSCGHSSWGDTNTCLLIPGRAPTTDKVHLGEPVSFIGVIYMGEGSLTGAEMFDGSCVTFSQELGAWSTLHSLQAAQQAGGSLRGSERLGSP